MVFKFLYSKKIDEAVDKAVELERDKVCAIIKKRYNKYKRKRYDYVNVEKKHNKDGKGEQDRIVCYQRELEGLWCELELRDWRLDRWNTENWKEFGDDAQILGHGATSVKREAFLTVLDHCVENGYSKSLTRTILDDCIKKMEEKK